MLNVNMNLFVVTPNGEKLLPMYYDQEDLFSTNQRIFITKDNLMNGTYAIHIKSKLSFDSEKNKNQKINGTIVTLGNVMNLKKVNTTKYNWFYLCDSKNTKQIIGNECVCNDKSAGIFCQHEIIEMKSGTSKTFLVQPYQILYFKYQLNNFDYSFSIIIDHSTSKGYNSLLLINQNEYHKYPGENKFMEYINENYLNYYGTKDDFGANDLIYFSYVYLDQTEALMNVTCKQDLVKKPPDPTMDKIINIALPLFFGGIIVAVLVYVIVPWDECRDYKNHENNNNSEDVANDEKFI